VSDSGEAEDNSRRKRAQFSQRVSMGEKKEGRMRTAAGILMVAFALFLLIDGVFSVSRYGIDVYDLALSLLLIIPAAFVFAGGVFCLQRKYRRVCLASASLAALIMILWLAGHAAGSIWLAWVVSMVGTFPIIFVCLTKKEWQGIQG
jgi:hypothetical protein